MLIAVWVVMAISMVGLLAAKHVIDRDLFPGNRQILRARNVFSALTLGSAAVLGVLVALRTK